MALSEIFTIHRATLLQWLTRVKLSRLIGVLLVILVTVPLLSHYYLSTISADGNGSVLKARSKLDHIGDYSEAKTGNLKFRIDELNRIRLSVTSELRDLESKRLRLQTEITGYNSHLTQLKTDYETQSQDLDKLKLSAEQAKLEKEEIAEKNTPELRAPERILPSLEDSDVLEAPQSRHLCETNTCFDFSRCSLLSGFPVYMYGTSSYQLTDKELEPFIKSSVSSVMDVNTYITYNPNSACLYIVLVGENKETPVDKFVFERNLRNLPSWRGDGRNHILLNLARTGKTLNIFQGVNTGRAIIAQSAFGKQNFRNKFDIVLPPTLGKSHGDIWEDLSPLVPARRHYLLSFRGQSSLKPTNVHKSSKSESLKQKSFGEPKDIFDFSILKELEKLKTSRSLDKFYFETKCFTNRINGNEGEWSICGTAESRKDILLLSTFALIISPEDRNILSSELLQLRLHECLKNGAIPVILGDNFILPYDEILPWERAVLRLSKARITELHFYLRTFSDADILELRRNGRIMFEKYLGTTQSIIDSMLALMRFRLQMPPLPIKAEPSPSVFNHSFVPLKLVNFPQEPDTVDEVLGPLEPPYPSPVFTRNYSIGLDRFRHHADPFHLYPSTPFEPVMPSEAKFIGSSYGFRPVGKGEGGSGKEFSEALGGNYPREQFTVVILTYEREAVLITAIQRLRGLPYLNKVVIVWNSPRRPSPDVQWPEIGVNVVVVKTKANSLNNRFLPYDVIETDAILSMDDDVHLRHDEIIFGFRVWRESRERLVGFPGRYHAWDIKHNSWLYNSNYSCELSMVLTGAAFIHKYYAFLYSYVMPQAIRDKVDEYTNCEDIAINFLISHITRKPPIKVTSRWTFHCPGCQQSLYTDDSHFQERHKCINFLTKVYGYMPLLNTQFRVDSVLFKTRISHDKQKCFRFI